jgi:hypothetical protein
MSITVIPSLLEQSTKSNASGTNPQVRTQLDVYSTSQVNAAISAGLAMVDLSAYTTLAASSTISGSLDTKITDLSGSTASSISSLNNQITSISGDIQTIDLSLTEAIFTHISPDGTSPSVTATPYAWGKIQTISGGPFWISLFR